MYGPFRLQIRQSRPTDIVFADTFAFQNILIIFRVEKHFNKTYPRPRRLQYLISRQCKPNGSYCNGRNVGRWIFNIQSIRHVCNFFFFRLRLTRSHGDFSWQVKGCFRLAYSDAATPTWEQETTSKIRIHLTVKGRISITSVIYIEWFFLGSYILYWR